MRRDDPGNAPVPATEPLPWPTPTVLEALRPVVVSRRLERIEEVIANRTRRFVPVVDGLSDPHNMSAILRSADAFGLQEVHAVETDQALTTARKVARGSERWLDIVKHANAEECVQALHERDCRVFVAAADGQRTPESLRAEPGRVAIVFGNEHRGVSEALRAAAEGTFTIPMRGFVESLNVSVAAAIAFRAVRGESPGDLTPTERDELLARFLFRTVSKAGELVRRHIEQAG